VYFVKLCLEHIGYSWRCNKDITNFAENPLTTSGDTL
jgi:hypothetical protein